METGTLGLEVLTGSQSAAFFIARWNKMENPNRYKFTKDDQVAGGKIQGIKSRDAKTGIHGLSKEEGLKNSSLGGKIHGPVQGAINKSTGQFEEIKKLPQSVEARLAWARSDENKIRAGEMGRKRGPNVDWEKVRTTESCKLGAKIGGPIGRHIRHHFNRKLLNPLCQLCVAAKERGESWWTAVYIPNPNSNKAGQIKPLSEYENC